MEETNKKFSQIYDRYVEKIYRYVFLRVNSREAAEDLTSETFLRGYEAFKKTGKKIENPQAFLYKTARNLVVDHYRGKGKAQLVSIEDSNLQFADNKINLEKDAMVASDLDQVRKAMAGLNEDYQNAIIWRYLEDLPVKEVAHLLDRSEEATRVLLHRAMNELKTKLA
ncbi:MAG TPA: sigma-70 family RNA polymerase sigma factor [Candidatus Paceibacterota bacterium]|nr:sigma-70 family RNA polymerase sigma factor [Candidatus Pacearchaeota archaeon]HRZ50688.1 sigma-70 family RNA polymerase sigma factor [Candidatus Paceibacterota bacterium]HSA36415.1 sigma-70 family RNA polymerase sigma factor [Candidatus Paceibacterota bacterium]